MIHKFLSTIFLSLQKEFYNISGLELDEKVLKNSGTKAITQPWTHQTCNLKYMSQCNFFFQTTTNLGDWIPTKVISACLHAYLSMNTLLEILYYRYRTRAIISRGLYIFYPIFHCGLYCRAVSTIYVKFGLFEKGTKF